MTRAEAAAVMRQVAEDVCEGRGRTWIGIPTDELCTNTTRVASECSAWCLKQHIMRHVTAQTGSDDDCALAYGSADLRYREARVLAALWIAHEIEDGQVEGIV